VKLAFFSDTYLPTRDGVAAVVSGLARELTRLGHAITVYTPNPKKGAPTEEVTIEGIPVVRPRAVPMPLYGEYRWAVFPFGQALRRQLGRDVDVIHLHTPGMLGTTAFFAARHQRKPLVGTFHSNLWAMRESFPRTLLLRLFFRTAWWYTRGTYWRCDLTTAPTEEARASLVRLSRKPFRRPVEVVPNGIELERFHPGIRVPDWRERCGFPGDPLVTYLGRLTADKGIHRFLDAVEDASAQADLVAIVAGTGPEEPAVRARLHRSPRLASRVRYVGPVAEEEKGALLSQSDLFVLPSTSDTSSVALLEAMACGVACVASDVGGPQDLIVDGVTGRLSSVLDRGPLAQTIIDLLERDPERRALGASAARYAQNAASIGATARRFISLYELLLTEVPHGVAGRTG